MNEQWKNPYKEEGYEVLCDAREQSHADLLLDEFQGAEIDAIQYPSSEETYLNFPPSETSSGILILVKKEQFDEAKALYEKLESGTSESAEE